MKNTGIIIVIVIAIAVGRASAVVSFKADKTGDVFDAPMILFK